MSPNSGYAVDGDDVGSWEADLVQLLPACKRCRTARKRCDTRLPACANCTRSGAECNFLDHITQELLPRKYIASMLNHLKSLQAARNKQFDTVSTEDTVPVSTDNGYHFVQARGGFRYLGSNALLAARPDFLSVPGAGPASTATRLEFPPVASLAGLVDSQWHQVLVGRYVQVLHKMYPVIDANQPCLQQPPGPSSNLSTFESFLSKMVCSIACHCLPGNDNSLVLLSDALYAEALVSLESITTDQDVEALQAILLLALRSLFDAQKGNIGQQVTFAQRLLTELGSRDVEDARATLQRLQCAVYCIGSEAATVLDRPPAVIAPDYKSSFSTTNENMFLCSLYPTKSGSQSEKSLDGIKESLQTEFEAVEYSPCLLAKMCQSVFLRRPTVESAMDLLACYCQEDMVLDAFTPHWAYKAGIFILQDSTSGQRTLKGHVLACTVLDRCAIKWPNARVLRQVLQDHAMSQER